MFRDPNYWDIYGSSVEPFVFFACLGGAQWAKVIKLCLLRIKRIKRMY